MAARRLEIHAGTPNPRTVKAVVEVLRSGGIVAYPTDTIYGLGCDITDKKAVERLYWARDLDRRHPLAFVCADLKHISRYAWVSDWQYKTMRRLVPGPFTFVLEASREVPNHMMVKKRREVGIRVPDHAVPLALVGELGNPIVSTSCGVDPETELALADADAIEASLGSKIDLILDAGPCGTEPSTVLSLLGDTVEVVRQGKGDPGEV